MSTKRSMDRFEDFRLINLWYHMGFFILMFPLFDVDIVG